MGTSSNPLKQHYGRFYKSSSFREGCLLVVNLGDDADTSGAIFGQLAGAFYGEADIPAEWRQKLALRPLIEDYAARLCQFAGFAN